MSALSSATDAGKRLRAVRERLRLSIREVERLSAELATKTNAPDYYISHTWLGEMEAGRLKPNIYRLKTLSLIYKRDLDELLAYFGISIRSAGPEHELVGLPHTQLLVPERKMERGTLLAPVALREKVELGNTNLVSRMFERWGEIPVELLQKMDWRNSLYGYIGIHDYTLYPILRPGSFVQIDSQQIKIQREGWRDEFERPIYFVELRDRYIASWCEISGNQLVLLPSPHSGQQASHVRYPGDADIVGRVTAVTMRIAESQFEEKS
jgi:transcriptional regulator with XRE-family HTH domain